MLYNFIFNFSGSELFLWLAWCVVFVWIFSIPNKIKERKNAKETLIELLNEKFGLGQINEREYLEKKIEIEELYDLDEN